MRQIELITVQMYDLVVEGKMLDLAAAKAKKQAQQIC
jgi:hypothetical protein